MFILRVCMLSVLFDFIVVCVCVFLCFVVQFSFLHVPFFSHSNNPSIVSLWFLLSVCKCAVAHVTSLSGCSPWH